MAVEDAEFGSLKLPTTLSVGALQAARSLNLPCGGFTAGLAFLVQALSPPRHPKRTCPPRALGDLFCIVPKLAGHLSALASRA